MPDTAPDVSADQLIHMLEHQQGLVDRTSSWSFSATARGSWTSWPPARTA
ncbi:MAG: hypothetical protein ACYSUF_00600 [Planctomycetota bacterium]